MADGNGKTGWGFLIGFLLVAGFIIGGFIIAIHRYHSPDESHGTYPSGSVTPTVSASPPLLATFQPALGHNDTGALGTLMVHCGCVMIRSRPPSLIFIMILWPQGVSVASDGAGGWVILRGDGQAVATVGDRVALTGNYLRPEDATNVSTGPIPEQCMTHHFIEAYDLSLGFAYSTSSPSMPLTA